MKIRLQVQCLLFAIIVISSYLIVQTDGQDEYQGQSSTKHPLEPLDELEVQTTSNFIKEKYALQYKQMVFVLITLHEPSKKLVLAYLEKLKTPGASKEHNIPRRAHVTFTDESTGKTYEVAVILNTVPTVYSFREFPPGTQPTLTGYDANLSLDVIRRDPDVTRRMLELGIEYQALAIEIWDLRYYWIPTLKDKRLAQVYLYFKEFDGDNEYAHPVNFLPIVDLTAKRIFTIEELPIYSNFSRPKETRIKMPHKASNFKPKVLGPNFYRKDVHQLRISGRGSFKIVDNYEVQWQKFRFRIGFNIREGLVLYNIRGLDEKKTWRSIIYRASIPELFVPYADPRPPFPKKMTLDFGDGGAGNLGTLLPGVDCLPDNTYVIDVVVNNNRGQPVNIPGAICIFEKDGGILHKHVSQSRTQFTIARSVILVVQTITTIGNYDYLLSWNFHQSGLIDFEARMTGLLSTNMVHESVLETPWASLMDSQVTAQYHQHIFCARLDMMVDGSDNSVAAVDFVSIIDPVENPYGTGFTKKEIQLTTESETSDLVSGNARSWFISNPNVINQITKNPVSWKLIPMHKPLLMAKEGSLASQVGKFATHALWVTKYHEEELYPAGQHINRHDVGQGGLPFYVRNNENIVNEDIVVWHSFGVTHIPRIEEYPIMATEPTGFTLKPCGFFGIYPGLDVPPPPGYNWEPLRNGSSSTFTDSSETQQLTFGTGLE